MKTNAPLNWYGGKFYMMKQIIPILENIEHKFFADVFGGGGHIIFNKKQTKIDIYNDIHSGLYNFMCVLRENHDELIRLLTLTTYSREEFTHCKANWQITENPIEKARQFYVASQQSFSNNFSTWSYNKTASNRGMATAVSRWLSIVDTRLANAVIRIKMLQIDNLDFSDFIKKYDNENILFYCDPPYLPKTRVQKKVYKHELSYERHEELVDLLNSIKGKYVVSGYDNELYNKLNGYKHSIGKYTLYAKKAENNNKRKKEEFLWIKS